MPRIHRIPVMIIAVLSVALVSCGTPKSTTIPEELKGSWTLTWWNSTQELPDNKITLVIDGDEIFGNSTCNGYQSTLTVQKDAFRLGVIGTTFVLCTGELESTENTYLGLLKAVSRWRVADGVLILSSRGADSLRFSSL